MKINTDAVRRLYRDKYHSAAEPHEENHAGTALLLRIATAMAFLEVAAPEIGATIDHVTQDMEKLRELEREEAFTKVFRCAVELLGKGEIINAER